MHRDISIVFLGSGPVALKSLQLLAANFTLEAIITKPTTQREMVAAMPHCPAYTASTRTELDELVRSANFQSKLAVLVDFGIIVSQAVIDSFPLGIVNSHFSLLPEWRGADPITFTILSGQQQTGVSLMLLSQGLDEGPLLAQAPLTVPARATTPSLTKDLIELSDVLLTTILPSYLRGDCTPVPQAVGSIRGTEAPSYSRKLTKADSEIDWSKPAEQVEREIRAFIEWPKSHTYLAKREVVITQARVDNSAGIPGQSRIEGKRLLIGCGHDSLEIERLKPIGKPEMSAEAFLAGYKQLL